MKRKSLLLITLLMAMFAPLALNAQQALPYTYGFEDNDLSTDGWTLSGATSSNTGINSAAKHEGDYGFRFYYSEQEAYLVSPLLTGTDNGVDVSFYYMSYSGNYLESFQVGYTSDEAVTDPSAFAYVSSITDAPASWQQYEVVFPAGTKRLAVKYVYTDAYYLFLDDFSFTTPPSCPKPTDLTVNYLGGTGATVTWTSDATSFNIDINGTVTNGVTSPYSLSNLELNTTYEVKVQAVCSATEQSEWASTSFTTDYCMPEDMCEISYELEGSYDSWYGAYLLVLDNDSEELLAYWTLDDGETGTLAVCNGRNLLFTWYSGNYDQYVVDGYTIYDANGDVITSNDGPMTSDVTYTMVCPDCAKPKNIEVLPAFTTASLSWEGENDSYVLQYRTAEVDIPADDAVVQDFENGFGEWTTLLNGEGSGWRVIDGAEWGLSNHGGDAVALTRSYENSADITADNWLISPQLTIPATMSFWAMGDASYPETYDICVSLRGTSVRDFEVVSSYTENPSNWTQYTVTLREYAGEKGYIAFHHNTTGGDYLLIDDIVIGELQHIDAGQWKELTTTENSIELTGLTSNTLYEYQLKGACGEEMTDWTASATFMTMDDSQKIFVTEGNWDVAANWMPEGVPTADQKVFIRANVVIPSGVVAQAKSITQENGTVTIKDGAELQYNTGEVTATVEKFIAGYTSTKDNYYLISSPVGAASSTDVENLLTGGYDYYYFDGTPDDELEWRNYKQTTFNMTTGWGYLYANNASEGVTLSWTDDLLEPSYYYAGGTSTSYLDYDEEAEFGTFNLMGNVYARKGYLIYYTGSWATASDVTDFYVMGDGELVPNTNPYLLPCEGAMIQSTEASQLILVATEPLEGAKRANSALNMMVSTGNKTVDVARIRFNEGSELNKIQLNPNHTKLFFTKDNKDFAVVSSEAQGEMPVSFKAENNGTYTLSFSNENVEFSYLHLIDNMTGNDVDLLVNPSYSFEAKTTDYASRFRLVFSTGTVTDDNFAFYTDGTIVINNDSNATLNVYDVTGRLVNTQSVNGSCQVNLNATAGVYMIQLVNGDNTKTQKIVVK